MQYITIPCHGISRKSGKRVGIRHRWNDIMVCEWCGRYKDEVRVPDPASQNHKEIQPTDDPKL